MAGQNELNPEFILIAGSIGMLLLTTGIIFFVYLFQRKLIKRKLAYQHIEDLLKKQELESAYALLEGKDIERKRIAEELHDNLGSILVTLAMYADTAIATNEVAKKNEMMTRARDIIIHASEETRKLSHRLDSVTLKHFGFETSLKDLFQVVNDTKSIHIESSISLDGNTENNITFNLYRIIQELINNTLKHANATSITVDISKIKEEYISLIYKDNGIGFSEKKVGSGIGLSNIKTRIEKLTGELTIESNKSGVSVVIEIPLR